MTSGRTRCRPLAVLLAASLVTFSVPSWAGLSGKLVHAEQGSPLSGARVWAADPVSGKVFPSAVTNAAGGFEITTLPAGTYELGVQLDRGLYLVSEPLTLEEGHSPHLSIAVVPRTIDAQNTPPPSGGSSSGGGGIWGNPLTAALIVLGAAVVVGVLVENATDDEDESSPF